jgi:hypothetical protein
LGYFIKSNQITGNPNSRTIGNSVTKDMAQNSASSTYNGYTFPANGYRFNDWGNDIFDGFGYFTLERVSDGSKVSIPFANLNTTDGVLYTTSFSAFGNTYSLIYGYTTQGIFKVEITLTSGTPIDVKFVIGGNYGSDGKEGYNDLSSTFVGAKTSTTYYIKYIEHYDTSGSDSPVYFYFIPRDTSYCDNSHSNIRSNSADNAYHYRVFNTGIIFYMSKYNDVISWIKDDIKEDSDSTKSDELTSKFLYYGWGMDKFGISKWDNQTIPKLVDDVLSLDDSANPQILNHNYTQLASDNTDTTDVLAKKISIMEQEATSLLDSISKNIKPVLFDSLSSLTDSLQYKNIGKGINDGLSLSDSLITGTTKVISDSIILTDSINKLMTVLKGDNIVLIESIANKVSKTPFVDSLALNDGISLESKKTINDAILLIDTFTKSVALLKTEVITISDAISSYTKKSLDDALILIESIVKNIAMNNIDDVVNLVDDYFNSDYIGPQNDVMAVDDKAYLKSERTISETSISLADSIVNIIKPRIDDVLSLADNISSEITELRNISDTININDSTTINILKIISDACSLIDIVSTEDLIYNTIQPDNIEVYDAINHLWNAYKALSDTISEIDSLKDSFGKGGMNETTAVSDLVGMGIGKIFTNDLILSDGSIFSVNKVINDVTSLVDNMIEKFTKVLSENILLNEAIEKNISLNNYNDLVNSLDSLSLLISSIQSSALALNDDIRVSINLSKQEALDLYDICGIRAIKELSDDMVGILDENLVKEFMKVGPELLYVSDKLQEVRRYKILNQVFIEGVSVPVCGLSIHDATTDKISTCTFTIPDPTPEILALCKQRADVKVYLRDGDGETDYFGGKIKQNPISTDSPITEKIDITANDYTDCAHDSLVSEVFENYTGTLTDMLKYLWTKYSTIENIDLSGVYNSDKIVPYMSFKYITLYDATEQICELLGWDWYVDWNGSTITLRCFPQSARIKDITFSRENHNVIAGTAKFGQSDEIINRLYVFGGKTYSSNYTYTIICNGSDIIYSIPHSPYPPSTSEGNENLDDGVKITEIVRASLNSGSIDVISEDISMPSILAPTPMIVATLNDVSLAVDFDYPYWVDNRDMLVNVQGRFVRFREDNKPKNGDVLKVTYRYKYPVAVMLDDSESIRQFGLVESTLVDQNIIDVSTAMEKAKQILNNKAFPLGYGSMEVTTEGLKAGDYVNVDMDYINAQGLYQIVDIEKKVENSVIVRKTITLNVSKNPEDIIAQNLKDFARRLTDLELKDVEGNTIVQKIQNVKERFLISDSQMFKYNHFANADDKNIVKDNYRVLLMSDGYIYSFLLDTLDDLIDDYSLNIKPLKSDNILISGILGITLNDLTCRFNEGKFGTTTFAIPVRE